MVAMKLGFMTKLEGMKFDEQEDGTAISTIQAFPYGTYNHPMYGKIEFDETKAAEMAKNVADGIRGQDLDIDYDHKAHNGKAAGWVKAAEAAGAALNLTVHWTKAAYEAIKAGEYKYFSPEFDWKWKHPQTQKVHSNVLFGGGITNRPFLKGILPINLSEFDDEPEGSEEDDDANKEKEIGMDPKLQRKLLGLPEDATDEQVTEALSKLPEDAVIGSPPAKVDDEGAGGAKDEAQPIAASDASIQEVIKLAETSTDPAVKALAELVGGLSQTVNVQGAALKLAETQASVLKLAQPQDGKMLSAGAQELLKAAMLDPTAENVIALAEGMVKGGVVPAGETQTKEHESDQDGITSVKQFDEKVEKLMLDEKISYAAAAERLAAKHPELWEGARQGSYSFVENRT